MFLKHPAWLWLKKYDKGKLPEPGDDLQARFDEGTLFEEYAEALFSGAVKLGYKTNGEFSGTKYYALPELTKKELDRGTKIILQGRVETCLPASPELQRGEPARQVANLTAIFDVLRRVGDPPRVGERTRGEAGNTFDLYEIKSSTSVKPEHIPDLAFQTIVLEKAGLLVRNISVLHVNNEYERNGDIEPEKISKKTDITADVRAALDETLENIKKAFEILAQKDRPDLSPRHLRQGGDVMSEWLEVLKAVNGEQPQYSVYKLCSINPETVGWLEDNGIEVLNDIPLDCRLTDKQLRQVEAMKSGEQHIDRDEIKDFLDRLEYPLHFFDYETMAGVIPAFNGYRPYQQVPFQYSLHILEKPGGELIHKEYLHTENSDPVPTLLKHLQEDFATQALPAGRQGSIISWYMSFEKGRNTEMGKMHPEYANFLAGLNDRTVDLMTPFAKGWFVDKEFFGSASIKWVLPALLPEFSYKELDISGGGQAQRIWMETVLQGKNPGEKEKVMSNLRKYCSLDTYAMYAIYKYLLEKIT